MGKTGLSLQFSPGRGYHFIAEHQLEAGTTVIREEPLACSISDTHWRMRCRHCLSVIPLEFHRTPKQLACSQCNRARFCNKECKKRGAGEHLDSGECALLANQAAVTSLGVFIREVCLALRLRYQLAKEELAIPLQSNGWKLLESKATDPEDKQLLVEGVRWMMECCGGNGRCSFDEGVEFLGQVLACGVELEPAVPGQGEEVRGAPCGFRERPNGVFKKVSRLNHSCRPNATYFCSNSKLVEVRTISIVSAGDEICIAYTDLLEPGYLRQFALERKFCFECSCVRCDAPNELCKDWFLTAVKVAGDSKVWAFRGNRNSRDNEMVCIHPSENVQSARHQIVGPNVNLLHHARTVEDSIQHVVRAYIDGYRESQNRSEDLMNLEKQVLSGLKSGIHLFHYTCLFAYSCLSSASHTQALKRRSLDHEVRATGPLLWKSALYASVHACAVDEMITSGEYGPVAHAIRSWCNLAGILCECLAEQYSAVKEMALCKLHGEAGAGVLRSISENRSSFLSEAGMESAEHSQAPFSLVLSMLEGLATFIKESREWDDNWLILVSSIKRKCQSVAIQVRHHEAKLLSLFSDIFPGSKHGLNVDIALSLCLAIAWVTAKAKGYLHICVGPTHAAMNTVSFMPFFHQLPPSVASKLCQASSMLQEIKAW